MAFVIKFAKGVRNHWKKSTFAACVLVYTASYIKKKYDIHALMKVYCEEALKYGKLPIDNSTAPRKVTVILNPAANKRNALDDFQNYCSPILNLAGICVDVIQTESEGHAKELVKDINQTDALLVAGGDGTLAEVVTGLMRLTKESDAGNLVPIGVLPLGKKNSVGQVLFPGGEHLSNIKSMAEASLAVVKEATKPMDVMKIEIIDEDKNKDENGNEKKPVYALSGIEWGAYRDASSRRDKYWYYGPLRKYATYIFNGYKDTLSWQCDAIVSYSPPCEGCSNCVIIGETPRKWYHRFLPTTKSSSKEKIEKSKVVNTECKRLEQKKISTADLACLTSNTIHQNFSGPPKLHLNMGPSEVDYLSFVTEGFRSELGVPRSVQETIEARQIEIRPNLNLEENQNVWFSIDNDDFEAKPIKVTLLPKIIKMFCKPEAPNT